MKKHSSLSFRKIISFFVFLLILCNSFANSDSPRTIIDFNANWKFHIGDLEDADNPEFSDLGWDSVQVPHDWSIAMDYTRENTAGCTGYLPGGVGWYRKEFILDKSQKNKVCWIEFDGIYRNASVWINGHFLGMRPYGYSSYKYDLTQYLKKGKSKNVLAVRVDRKEYMDSRWYPGSGIYRDVRLITTSPVHIAHWGTFVTTPKVSKKLCEVQIESKIQNGNSEQGSISLLQEILDSTGRVVGKDSLMVDLGPVDYSFTQTLEIDTPQLWTIERPYLYSVRTSLFTGTKKLDEYLTTFGIRTLRFDANSGFYLNGQNMKMKGVCLHHDAGIVGAAVPNAVWERRFNLLKEAGVNAIRTAHNPPSPDFLDLCDKMGILVQVEAFDEWSVNKNKWIDSKGKEQGKDYGDLEYGYGDIFQEWAERDIKDMVLRDRNHPSVIMWSLGNEIEWTFPYYWHTSQSNQSEANRVLQERSGGDFKLVEIARQLNQWIKELDTTRPTTAGEVLPEAGNLTGYCDAVDVTGYNYMAKYYNDDHENFPERIMYGSENFPQWQEWKDCIDRDYISGVFLWPGISYLGEAGPYPRKAASGGLLDLAGFKHPRFYFFKSFWQEKPVVHFTTQLLKNSHYKISGDSIFENQENPRSDKWGWPQVNNHWNYDEGDSIYIECYTNAEKVELLLNYRSQGVRVLKDNPDRILKWVIPYKAGTLRAMGITRSPIGEYSLTTAEKAVGIQLSADKDHIQADGKDLVHLTAQLVDTEGIPVRHDEKEIQFILRGDARIVGVGNGNANSVQKYQSDKCKTDEGKCLLIVQGNYTSGELTVEAFLNNKLVSSVDLTLDKP